MHKKSSIIWLLVGFLSFKICSQTELSCENALRNIIQLTFPSMAFEKAGESYFSPDGKALLLQAVPPANSTIKFIPFICQNLKLNASKKQFLSF